MNSGYVCKSPVETMASVPSKGDPTIWEPPPTVSYVVSLHRFQILGGINLNKSQTRLRVLGLNVPLCTAVGGREGCVEQGGCSGTRWLPPSTTGKLMLCYHLPDNKIWLHLLFIPFTKPCRPFKKFNFFKTPKICNGIILLNTMHTSSIGMAVCANQVPGQNHA